MDIEEFLERQRKFDKNFPVLARWSQKTTQENLDVLGYLLLCAQGEIGECCNIFKKVVRNDVDFESAKPDIAEEVVDAFIYLLKIIDSLGIDIEKEFLSKQAKNYEKFKRLGK